MPDLKKALEGLGCTDVRTVLASGNAMFNSPDKDISALAKKIEAKLEKTFGFPVRTLLRTQGQIDTLIASNPFKGIKVTKETRLYVTFLPDEPKGKMKLPYTSRDGNFRILKMTDDALVSVLTVTPGMGSVDAMAIIEKTYGKDVTTRNWNTIVKMG